MTPKQTTLYWREWAAVRRAKPDADRDHLTITALGSRKSSKAFNNSDLDRVLAVFRAISQPGSLNAQMRQIAQPRDRLLYTIAEHEKCLRLYVDNVEGYTGLILSERFGARSVDDLSDHPDMRRTPSGMVEQNSPLLRYCMTLNARLQVWRKNAGHTLHQMRTLSDVNCDCAVCRRAAAPVPTLQPAVDDSDPY